MRIAVIGAGGLGSWVGALLARQGNQVYFIARGAQLDALSTSLELRSVRSGNFHVKVEARSDARTIGPVDVVLFCVKTYDTETALEHVPPLLGPRTIVMSLQNGVEGKARLIERVGAEHVVGGLAYVNAVRTGFGVVEQPTGPNRLLFGELDGRASARTKQLFDILNVTGIAAELRGDIRSAIWEKFIVICAYCGVLSLARSSLGPVLADPDLRALFRGTMAEVAAIAATRQITFDADFLDRQLEFLDRFEPQARSSMDLDLEAGGRLELDALNGSVVRLGRETNIPCPLNLAIYAALKPFERGRPPAQAITRCTA